MPTPNTFLLQRAKDSDRSTIERLIQLYLYDMAADHPFRIEDDGTYSYPLLDRFWEHAYLLRTADEIAGFALVTSACPITGKTPCWFMAEFFVLRHHRKKSIGKAAVRAIIAVHPGPWHVATQLQNAGADAFWACVLPASTTPTLRTRFDDADWVIRRFRAD